MKIVKKLQEWHDNHLLSTQQMHQIIQFEQHQSQERLFPGFVWLGLAIIVLGLIAIIAANWASIPANVKLISDFILLISTAAAAYHFRAERFVFDTLLFLLALLSLATIGLIGQVFQTGGTLPKALLLWALITLPLACISQHRILPLVWVWVTLVTASYQILNDYVSYLQPQLFAILLVSTVVASLCIAFLLKRLSYFGILQYEFLNFGLIGTFLITPLVEQQLRLPRYVFVAPFISAGSLLILFSSLTMVGLLLLLWRQAQHNYWQRYLLVPAALIAVAMVCLLHLPIVLPAAVALAMTLLLYLFLTVFFALNNQVWLYRLGLFCIGLRMLWLYWHLLQNLTITAIVMLITGVILLVVSRALLKYKAAFFAYIGYHKEQP
jgi:uncharacterized membrane protein